MGIGEPQKVEGLYVTDSFLVSMSKENDVVKTITTIHIQSDIISDENLQKACKLARECELEIMFEESCFEVDDE